MPYTHGYFAKAGVIAGLLLFLLMSSCSFKGTASLDAAQRARLLNAPPPDSIRARARVTLEGSSLKGRAIVLVKAPDMIRIDVLGPMGGLAFALSFDGYNCHYLEDGEPKRCLWKGPWLDLSEEAEEADGAKIQGRQLAQQIEPLRVQTAQEGQNQDQPFKPRVGLPVTPAELASFLTGNMPRGWSLEEAGPAEALGFGAIKAVKYDRGVAVATITMDEFSVESGARVPLVIKVKGAGEAMSVEYTSVEANPELDDSLFSLLPVEGDG